MFINFHMEKMTDLGHYLKIADCSVGLIPCVLSLLLYRAHSEKISAVTDITQRKASWKKFNYTKQGDEKAENLREIIRKELGFFIKPSELFENVIKDHNRIENISNKIENIFENIKDSYFEIVEKDKMRDEFCYMYKTIKNMNVVDKCDDIIVKLMNKVDRFFLWRWSTNDCYKQDEEQLLKFNEYFNKYFEEEFNYKRDPLVAI